MNIWKQLTTSTLHSALDISLWQHGILPTTRKHCNPLPVSPKVDRTPRDMFHVQVLLLNVLQESHCSVVSQPTSPSVGLLSCSP